MFTKLQRSFAGGVIAPEFYGKGDWNKYAMSLKTCQGFKITRAGNLTKCPGTTFVTNTPNNLPVRLFKFRLDAQTGFLLEFSNQLLRFFQSGTPVVPNSAPWSNLTNYVPGQAVTSGGNTYICLVANGPGTSVVQPGVTVGWQSFWFLGSATIYELPTPFLQADLAGLDFRQINGVMYIVHKNYPPQKLIFTTLNGVGLFQLTIAVNIPSIFSNYLLLTGGPTIPGNNKYFYKATVVNLATGEESFPFPSGSLPSGADEIQQFTAGANWGPPGATILFPGGHFKLVFNGQTTISMDPATATLQDLRNNFEALSSVGAGNSFWTQQGNAGGAPAFGILAAAGLPINVEFINALGNAQQNLITFDVSSVFLNQSSVQVNNPVITETQAGHGQVDTGAVITNVILGNPTQITTKSAHGLKDGNEVLIYGSGVAQLDNRVFNVQYIDKTHLNIFVDSTTYTPWVSSGFIQGTVMEIDSEPPLLSQPITINLIPNKSAPAGYNPNQVKYNFYAGIGGQFGFIGSSQSKTFQDTGIPPDFEKSPPSYNPLFVAPNDYPGNVETYQQRLILGGTKNNPLELDASRVGFPENFTTRQQIQDNDAIIREPVEADAGASIKHLLNFGFLIVFTDQGEIVISGDATGTLTPTGINARPQTFNGAASLHPLKVNKSAVYLQSQTSLVRDLQVTLTPYGFTYISASNELSLFAKHLVEGFSIVDWDFQRIYDSIIWMCRNDGLGLGLTYNSEEQIMAWFTRKTQGNFENFCTVPEALEDVGYWCVKRVLGGQTLRFIERMDTDQWTELDMANYLDCTTLLDGRNVTVAPTTTMTLSPVVAGKWTPSDQLQLTASAAFFNSGMIGDEIHLTGTDGFMVRFTIITFTDSTHVLGFADRTIPDGVTSFETDGTVQANMRSVAISVWGHATTIVLGLNRFNGQQVAVWADGRVICNPNNPVAGTILTVANNEVILPIAAVVIRVGLPFTSDIETLDIDDPRELDAFIDKKTIVKRASCLVLKSQDFWVGAENPDTNPKSPQNLVGPVQTPDLLYALTEAKFRENAGYDAAVDLTTGTIITNFSGEFNRGARMFLRSIDPTPCAFSAIGLSIEIPSMGK